MSKLEKLLRSLKNNPENDWTIGDLKFIAQRYDVEFRQLTFRALNGKRLTVPARKPIKPIYIKLFIKFIEQLMH